MLPSLQEEPASYPEAEVWTLDRDATIADVCQFIVEYINSDVMVRIFVDLDLLSTATHSTAHRAYWPTGTWSLRTNRRCGVLVNALRHLYSLTYRQDGVYDNNCKKLAKLYSQAVDYAKNGIPVDITNDFPRPLIKFKPDWSKGEVTGARDLDYYESDRALGYLFRNISVYDPSEPLEDHFNTPEPTAPLEDAISLTLAPLIQRTLDVAIEIPGGQNIRAEGLHARFVREMRAVCMSHALLDSPDVHLMEEEVVLGIILAKSVQPRLRKDREYRMRLHADMLVRDIRGQIAPAEESEKTNKEFRDGLQNAWVMWGWAQHHRDKAFIESFSFIALGVILDCLKQLGALPKL